MASGTGIGRAQLDTQIRPRIADAVIAAGMDFHIGRLRHVALDARRAGRIGLVKMVRRRIVLARRMLVTGRTQRVVRMLQLGLMRVVAIRAADPLVIHLALDERGVLVHLVQNLAVGVVGRAEQQFAVEVIAVLVAGQVVRVDVRTAQAIAALRPLAVAIELGFHAHNDLGMATANALAAVSAQADGVDVTVGGLGERAGNAALEEVVMGLEVALGLASGVDTTRLQGLCHAVFEAAGWQLPPHKPIVGRNAFRHESGIHVRGMLQDRRTYEPFFPARVGCPEHPIEIGKHSGTAAIRHVLGEAGLAASDRAVRQLLPLVRRAATRKKRALSSEELAALYRRLGESAIPF
jgi:hypothetical protein